ncbi:MAG: putative DNA-binding domain-containing protein [Sphingomonadaceae bacterium]
MKLLALQNEFRAALLADNDDDLATPFGAAATPGLSVYRNAYRARLMECLRNSFEKVWSWVGDEAFDAAACHHIILTPPHSWTLDDYGDGFDQTLASLFPGDPEIPDLAWLEWAMQRAFASLDGPVVTPADLTSDAMANCDWDNVTFSFVDSLQTRIITSNCTGIWLALANETDMPELITLEDFAALHVWRKGFSPQFYVADENEHRALTMAMAGDSFGQICEALADHQSTDEAIAAAGGMLGRWIGEGMVAALEIR